MNKKLFFITHLFLIFFLLNCGAKEMTQNTIYKYLDGNGNEYLLRNDKTITLEYYPVKPEFSSSGTYSGGEYKEIVINQSQYEAIVKILTHAFKNKEIQMDKRVMMSCFISITDNNKKNSAVIKPGSEIINKIETLLKDTFK